MTLQCTGFVWMQSQAKCWRRNNIVLSQCERGRFGHENYEFATCVQEGWGNGLGNAVDSGKAFLAPLKAGATDVGSIGDVVEEPSDATIPAPRDTSVSEPSDASDPESSDANAAYAREASLPDAAEAPDSEPTDAATAEIAATQTKSTGDLVLDLLFSENLTLSAELASQTSNCHGAYMDILERTAPGCLAQCQNRGVCGAVSRAIGAYLPTKDRSAAKRVVCSSKGAFACLFEGSHRGKCGSLIAKAGHYGIPTSAGSLYSQCR